MRLQAFIDDSYDDEAFVLAGHIARASSWALFAKDWEELLRYGALDANGTRHVHMAEMTGQHLMANVPFFGRAIERNVLLSVSARYNFRDMERAKARIYSPNVAINWGFTDNKYLMAFRILMDMFHNERRQLNYLIDPNEPIDFIFDEQTEKKKIQHTWIGYIEQRPANIRHLFGEAPRFVNDRKFLAIQAADMWAWWVRKWHKDGTIAKRFYSGNFELWKRQRDDWPIVDISITEDQFVEFFKSQLRLEIGPGRIIYDLRYGHEGQILKRN